VAVCLDAARRAFSPTRGWAAAVDVRAADSRNLEEAMLDEFRKFLLQTNALALAVGVIIGAAVGKVVSSLVSDILMPVVGIALPGGAWREQKIVLSSNPDGTVANAITYGAFIGNIVDFVIIALIVFLITKALLKPAPAAPAPPTKECPACLEIVPKGATRCRACTSAL
jgi:large conductance mechanosensitive channel